MKLTEQDILRYSTNEDFYFLLEAYESQFAIAKALKLIFNNDSKSEYIFQAFKKLIPTKYFPYNTIEDLKKELKDVTSIRKVAMEISKIGESIINMLYKVLHKIFTTIN